MNSPALFTKEAQKEQRRMKKKLDSNEITGDEYSIFLDKEIEKGHLKWKNFKVVN